MNSTFLQDCEAVADRFDLPALAVGMAVGDREELAAAGCAPDTVFRIASITKPFTATVVLRELSTAAETDVWPGIRVGELLSHTSGYDCECGDLTRFGDADDALSRLVVELPSVRRWLAPGEAWSYSNAGYWLAGWLAATARGTTYEELVERLAAEIGLQSTSFGPPELGGTGPGVRREPYPRTRRPSGGLVSNVGDLLRFGRWLLSDPAVAAMRVSIGRPVAGVYGLGLAGDRIGGSEVWGHGGSYGGFESSFLLVPGRDAVFAGLTNSGTGREALRAIEDVFFERVLGARRPVPEAIELPAAELRLFAGRYANSETTYDLAVHAGGLELSGAGMAAAHAQPIESRTFRIVEGEDVNDRFDFPLAGFVRIGGRLAERVT